MSNQGEHQKDNRFQNVGRVGSMQENMTRSYQQTCQKVLYPHRGSRDCAVCKRQKVRQECENLYLEWFSAEEIAKRLELPVKDINLHIEGMNLDRQRGKATEAFYSGALRTLGPKFLQNPDVRWSKAFTTLLQQYDRCRGAEQKARKNDLDVKREQEYLHDMVMQLMVEANFTRPEAVDYLKEKIPELSDLLN